MNKHEEQQKNGSHNNKIAGYRM